MYTLLNVFNHYFVRKGIAESLIIYKKKGIIHLTTQSVHLYIVLNNLSRGAFIINP